MLILTIRTDKPDAEIGVYDDGKQLVYETWYAHRQLAETLHGKIDSLLEKQGKHFDDIQGLVAFQGPGSFTGLRIGLTVANAIAYSNGVPIVAKRELDWIEQGIASLLAQEDDIQAMPFYGADAHITPQKK